MVPLQQFEMSIEHAWWMVLLPHYGCACAHRCVHAKALDTKTLRRKENEREREKENGVHSVSKEMQSKVGERERENGVHGVG